MQRIMGTTAISMLVLFAACGENETVLTAPGVSLALQANAKPQPSIPLIVTVAGAYNLQSDGVTEPGYTAGDYVSGINGMLAELDGPGNLQFGPVNGSSNVAPLRTLVINYGAQLTFPAGAWTPNMTNQHNFKILTRGLNGNPRIQDLADGASGCYPLTIATESGGSSSATSTVHHRAEYNPALSTGAPAASYVRVSRSGVAAATVWSVVPDGSCGGTANVAAVRSQDLIQKNAPLVYRGNYAMQFALSFRMK